MMNTDFKETIFERRKNITSEIKLPESFPSQHVEIMKELLESESFDNSGLCMDKFLEPDKTINLEKLELAILLYIEYVEFSDKSEKPIYLFLRNMDKYFELRGVPLSDIGQITEESTFILGFCNAIAQEEKITRDVNVLYERRKNAA